MRFPVLEAYRDPNPSLRLSCDALVIGSGAAGAVLGWRLARAGLDTLIVEEGGYFTPEEFDGAELRSSRSFYQEKSLRMALGNQPMAVLQGRIVGGSPTVNEAVVFRTPPEVLTGWARDYDLKDHSPEAWARSFETLDAVIHTEKLPFERLNANNRLFVEACRALGFKADTSWRNTRDCVGCGTCSLGCSAGAKMDPTQTFLPQAQAAGARIAAGLKVTRLESQGGRVTRARGRIVEPRTEATLGEFSVQAKHIFLSGGAVNSAHLLLRAGLQDPFARVGRGLRLHPTTTVLALFDRDIEGYRGDPIGAYCDEFFHGNATTSGFILEPIFIHPMMFAVLVPGFGLEHKTLMRQYNRMGMMIVQAHDRSEGVVAAGLGGRPLVRYKIGPEDANALVAGMKRAAEIYFAAGARAVLLPHVQPRILERPADIAKIDAAGFPTLGVVTYSAHPQGGVAMGERARLCPLDSHGLLRGTSNLVVCDAGSFPTSVGVNPMLSVMALADQVGLYWADRLGKKG